MRLRFKKGKQKEFLKLEKEKLSLTWPKFAKYLGIKHGKLRTFIDEQVSIDSFTFNKLRLKSKYKKFIIEELSDNWGRSKGGKNSFGSTKTINIPEKNEELAELWGIVLGDGCVYRLKKYKIGVYCVKIAGHSINDKEYLLNFVKPLCDKLFGIRSRINYSKNKNCIYVILDSRKIVDFFEDNEFKAGNKIVNQSTIPNWIKKDNKSLAFCLRGLFDTDGSFYQLTNQNSYQINFKNNNLTLLNDLREGLIQLGILPSKIIRGNSLVITKKSEIEKFYKLIGFSNPKHLNKIKKLF